MINYNIADFVARFNNSIAANKKYMDFPLNKENYQLIILLTKLGLTQICLSDDEPYSKIRATIYPYVGDSLVGENLENSINKIKSRVKLKTISKPGRRVYIGYREIKDFNHGHRTYILRTSKGIISSQTAIKEKIGGELLIKIDF